MGGRDCGRPPMVFVLTMRARTLYVFVSSASFMHLQLLKREQVEVAMACWQISYVFNDEGGRPRA
eukprot:8305174-Lingulodinium_polyedra.AAC.1